MFIAMYTMFIFLTLYYRLVRAYYSHLEPFFVADPLLRYDFVYICPEDDYTDLFRMIPAFISLNWLMFLEPLPQLVKNVSFMYVLQFLQVVVRLKAQKWDAWLKGVEEKITEEPIE